MKVEILNATVVSVENRQVTMKNNEVRAMQLVQVSSNGSRGVQLDGVEVWDDQIEKLNLQQGQLVNITCEAVGRLFGGRFSYTLRAYKAEQVQAQQNAATSNQPVDLF